jgi:hypothetical protein
VGRRSRHRVYGRSNPIESTFASVRHRTKVTKGPFSKAAGIATAFKLIDAAQERWRAVNAPHLVAVVRAGARFECGKLGERDPVLEATQAAADSPVQSPTTTHAAEVVLGHKENATEEDDDAGRGAHRRQRPPPAAKRRAWASSNMVSSSRFVLALVKRDASE